MKGYYTLRKQILEKLKGLSPELKYHGLHHTLDVLNVCNSYVKRYKLSKREAKLLRIAALAHDMGFLKHYKEHERLGVDMVSEMMENLGFSKEDISEVAKMIMATKIGVSEETLLEKIISDADLDYLGRDDFPRISNTLYEELQHLKRINDYKSWMQLQINFFKNHKFQTKFAIENRAPSKKEWFQKLLEDA